MAEALHELGPSVTAIVLHSAAPQDANPFEQIDAWDKSPATLSRLLHEHKADVLWIQYSGYGFDQQGVPRYLALAIRSLNQRPRIVIYYHETHCTSRQLGWKGVLVSPRQKQVGKALAATADVVFTSTKSYAQAIQSDYGVSPNRITLLPLGSNVAVPAFSEREREAWRSEFGWSRDCVAVVYGAASSQHRTLLRHQNLLMAALDVGVIQRIVCVGGEPGSTADAVLRGISRSVVQATNVLGHQSPDRISKILIAADAALMKYPFQHFGKSGVFMTYSMAGLPLLVGEDVTAGVTMFRGACLVGGRDFDQLRCVISDVVGRIARQQEAHQRFSWRALANSAIGTMSELGVAISTSPLTEKSTPGRARDYPMAAKTDGLHGCMSSSDELR
jgi:hypothetical protein